MLHNLVAALRGGAACDVEVDDVAVLQGPLKLNMRVLRNFLRVLRPAAVRCDMLHQAEPSRLLPETSLYFTPRSHSTSACARTSGGGAGSPSIYFTHTHKFREPGVLRFPRSCFEEVLRRIAEAAICCRRMINKYRGDSRRRRIRTKSCAVNKSKLWLENDCQTHIKLLSAYQTHIKLLAREIHYELTY